MLKSKLLSRALWVALGAVVLTALLPVMAAGQRRWVTRYQTNRRIVVYQPRPYMVYQRRPSYSYRTYRYGYTEPYYASRYYSYPYSQPYIANRYTYSWANPTYRYDDYRYRNRHRRSGLRIGIRLR